MDQVQKEEVVEEPRLEGQVLLERLLVAIKTETQTL
jgi:hypothetical protein